MINTLWGVQRIIQRIIRGSYRKGPRCSNFEGLGARQGGEKTNFIMSKGPFPEDCLAGETAPSSKGYDCLHRSRVVIRDYVTNLETSGCFWKFFSLEIPSKQPLAFLERRNDT